MNFRHAAALALVGWYLMYPPAVGEKSNHQLYGKTAVLSAWTIFKSFDTAKECEDEATALKNQLEGQKLSLNDPSTRLLFATCFATDDPRLK